MITEASKRASDDDSTIFSRGDLRFFRSCLGNIQKSIRERKSANKPEPSSESLETNCVEVRGYRTARNKERVSPKSLFSYHLSDSGFGKTISSTPLIENAVQSDAIERTDTLGSFMAIRCATESQATPISEPPAKIIGNDTSGLVTPGVKFSAPLGTDSAVQLSPQNMLHIIASRNDTNAIPELDVSATNLDIKPKSLASSSAVGELKTHPSKNAVNSLLFAVDTSSIDMIINAAAPRDGKLSTYRSNFVSPRSVKTTGI